MRRARERVVSSFEVRVGGVTLNARARDDDDDDGTGGTGDDDVPMDGEENDRSGDGVISVGGWSRRRTTRDISPGASRMFVVFRFVCSAFGGFLTVHEPLN